ncbi:CopG family transcriptional regulator [Novosphingobium sp. 9]|uniref:CopG family transcriptional regulator n=1 Tax=Novosphingobium sp. 9 TaxID=2025349 RepID=UPI0021B6B2E1|nr:CopG family transcriptional regulator [Novosphingobium sp. 9]
MASMQTRKTRHQFYLPDHLSARLDTMAGEPGASKTTILSEALAAWIQRTDDEQTGAQFGKVLARQARASERLDQRVDHLTEVLGLFVRYYLTFTAHHPAFDEETRNLGLRRYENFLRHAGELAAKKSNAKPSASPPSPQENEA